MMNLELLKKPYAWAIIIPALLLIWTISAAAGMFSQRDKTQNQVETASTVEKNARQIINLLNRSGRSDLIGSALPPFGGMDSARACADAATIPLTRLTRGESGGKPKKDKQGRLLHRENYKLHRVRLLQIARFVDHAERDYSSLSCTQLMLTSIVGDKNSDSWDATVSLQYFTRE
jgi:hypothetical protein